jgi:hypothetical protein
MRPRALTLDQNEQSFHKIDHFIQNSSLSSFEVAQNGQFD